jgi:hypothetical protein
MLNFILTTLIPTLGVVLTTLLLIYGVYARWIDVSQKLVLTRPALLTLIALAVACNAWVGVRMFMSQNAKQAWEDGAALRESRQRFVLREDFQYGELLIPAGSLINRTDPFDRGEPGRPLALHGLDAVRFPQPTEVAGVMAAALHTLPMRVELAENQRIGPVYRYDTGTQTWLPNKVMPAINCKKGQVALFQVPHIEYDVVAEVGKPPPDGPNARFLPGQWLFKGCENGPPIVVQPAYAGGPVSRAAQPQ